MQAENELGDPVVCERLIRARKSLTRSHHIDESIDNLMSFMEKNSEKQNDKDENCDFQSQTGASVNLTENPLVSSELENNKFEESSLPIKDDKSLSEDEIKIKYNNEEKSPDNLSDSLSVIRMDKFELEKRRASRVLHRTFIDPNIEHLFQIYHGRQRRADLFLVLIGGVFLGIYSITVIGYGDFKAEKILPISLFAITSVIELVLIGMSRTKIFPEIGWTILPFLTWIICVLQLTFLVIYNPHVSGPRQALLWLILYNFLFLALLPLRLLQAVLFNLTAVLTYFIVSIVMEPGSNDLLAQVLGSLFLVVGANLLGLMSYFFADKKHRRAFLETRKSLEVKMVIEDQSKEQERLLLSVLPKHVAEMMRQDWGCGGDQQFKKIYMSRHENVSILFADIVGFTAISSTYTASELVKMLNELFARFDGLADKYQQLRIKILGDCYYCISGAPKERPEHAILCVHMGLAMIEAIKYVRETTKCGVDMRVGIHTGAVLAGVLGQRQWQFDVYSKDVFLANKMESSGKSGHVHVSSTTVQYLENHFALEPAGGEKREDAIRAASLKTYFISKVLVPYKALPSLGMIRNGGKSPSSSNHPSKEIPSDNNTMASRDSMTLSTMEEARLRCIVSDKGMTLFAKKLHKELISRDGTKDLLKKASAVTFTFNDRSTEESFRKQRETFSGAATTALPLVLLIITCSRFALNLKFELGLVILPLCFLIVLSLTSIPAARSFRLPVCDCIIVISDWMHSTQLRRSLWFILIATVSAFAVLFDMYYCDAYAHALLTSTTSHFAGEVLSTIPNISSDKAITETTALFEDALVFRNKSSENSGYLNNSVYDICPHVAYYSYFTLLVLLATSLLAQMNFLLKCSLLVGITLFQCIFNFLVSSYSKPEDLYLSNQSSHLISENLGLSIELLLITILLLFLSRQMESASRLLYLWRREVEDQRSRAEEIRQRNEALVYNILPTHVASHFMGMRKKKHEELYSQSYEEVGVLFASMPNFGDFYSEESVNNQGLECYRFLNEVISDFDMLLENKPFDEITKIKTIGSTYMAASGLNLSRQNKEDDPIKVRWTHLALLVDFAFELVQTLQSLNEQSFNHFVLRMGINHGPIIAGVIGARKPHYDIWGNTVNVASRMESTGKAGCIQVTEDTCNILRNFGYVFEQRGVISVKGKGELMTYYLMDKSADHQTFDVKSANDSNCR